MTLVRQWSTIEAGLPESWGEAKLALTLADESRRARAAALLAPLAPGRSGNSFRFAAVRQRAGASSAAITRALSRLDEERIPGELRLVATDDVQVAVAAPGRTLLAAWERELAVLRPVWSDALVAVRLRSSDLVERGALLCSPLNPGRTADDLGFRFRAARVAGYGAPPELTRRCFSRMDEEAIQGDVQVLRSLADSRHVYTQGPVWYVVGKVV